MDEITPLLLRSGPMTAEAIGTALGLSHEGTYMRLVRLYDTGLIRVNTCSYGPATWEAMAEEVPR